MTFGYITKKHIKSKHLATEVWDIIRTIGLLFISTSGHTGCRQLCAVVQPVNLKWLNLLYLDSAK